MKIEQKKWWQLGTTEADKRWQAYLSKLQHEESPLDHIILQAVANLYNVKVMVLTPDGSTINIMPFRLSEMKAELILGHLYGNKFALLLESGTIF